MLPEAARAIEIADRHLPGTPPAQREALAKDIVQAVNDYAKRIAMDTLKTVLSEAKRKDLNGDHCIEEDQDEMAEAEMNCGMGKDGQCSQAGTEYCDWNCPFGR